MAPIVYETLLFDLDSTLYPAENGYEEHVLNRIFEFMHVKLDVPKGETRQIWRHWYEKTNQTLKALRLAGFQFDKDEYWDFIRAGHDQYIQKDEALRRLLESLPQEKWVLTNCQEKHAVMALDALGITDCFKGVLGADFMGGHCKPDKEVWELVLQHTGAHPSSTVFFDDSLKNVKSAKAAGMTSVLVVSSAERDELKGTAGQDLDGVDAQIGPVPTEANLHAVLPQLWTANSS